jgi:hypothetical protein
MGAVFLRALLIWLLAWLMADSVEVLQIAVSLSGERAAADADDYIPIAVRHRQQVDKQVQASFFCLSTLDCPPPHPVSGSSWQGSQAPSLWVPPQAPSRFELMSLQV